MKFYSTVISGIFAAGVLAYYGAVNFFLDGTSPLVLLGVLVFVVGCISIFFKYGQTSHEILREHRRFYRIIIIAVTCLGLYALSFLHYLPTGLLLGSVIGGLAGGVFFSHNRHRFLASQILSAVILGTVVFVLARGVFVDVLTMASGSLEPKIHKGQKILISYLSFGIRTPFYPYPLLQWGVPKAGELVIVLGPGGNPYMREVLNTREAEVLVNVDGWVSRKTLLAKGWPIEMNQQIRERL